MTVVPKPGDVFHGEDGSVSVVLPDMCDPNVEPTREEVEEYAEWLGIDVQREPQLLGIAREGLMTPLPPEWRACRTGEGEVYYFNFHTGDSSWDHPMDEVFKQRVEAARGRPAGMREEGKGKEKKSKTTTASSTASSSITTTGSGEGRRLEKGAAGNVESPKWAGKNINTTTTIAAPSSLSKAPLSLQRGNALGQPTPTVRLGRLGALGTPAATQRIQPDVSDLFTSPTAKTDRALTRFNLGGGNSSNTTNINTTNNNSNNMIHNSSTGGGMGSGIISSPTFGGLNIGLGKQTKTVDGAKDLEAHIRQRVNDEIEARRRAMRLRYEKELNDESEITAAALEKAKLENERKLTIEEQQQQRGEQNSQTELQTKQRALERQYEETNERVTSLRNKLQQQKSTLENKLNQAIAEAKEKLQRNHNESLAKKREMSAATLKNEKEKLTNGYAKDLEVQSKISERKKTVSVENFEKELNTARLKRIEELAAKRKEATTTSTSTSTTINNNNNSTSKSVEEAQKAYEAAVEKAASEATTSLETLRRDYTARVEKLQASKDEKIRAKEAAKRAEMESTPADKLAKQKEQASLVEAEEARLRKALNEKIAKYEEETRRIVTTKQAEANSVKPTPTPTPTKTPTPTTPSVNTENNNNNNNNNSVNAGNSGKSNSQVRPSPSIIQEQRRFEVASRQLDAKHDQTMMRIRNEHTKALRDRNIFDPRESPEYSALVQEQQKAWLSEHPAPTQTSPAQDSFSSKTGVVTTPTSLSSVSTKGEKEQQKPTNVGTPGVGSSSSNCSSTGKDGKKTKREQQLEELGATLEKEVKEAIDAYRAKRMEEIRAELTKYRETLAEQEQKRLSNLSANINAEAEAKARAKYPLPLPISSPPPPNTTNTTNTTTANKDKSSSAAVGTEKPQKTLLPNVNTVTIEEAKRREDELRLRLQARIDILQETLQRAELELQQKLDEAQRRTTSTVNAKVVSSPTATVWQRPPPVPTTTTAATTIPGMISNRQEQVCTPHFSQLQPQSTQLPQPQSCSFSTPVLNRTFSTIAPVNSLWSSARPSPTHQFSWLDTANTFPTPQLNERQDGPTQERLIDNPTTTTNVVPQKDLVFEDRLRRAKLLLKERKDQLRIQQNRMRRAREVWLRDMKDCHKRHDRERAVLLRQIKVALEQKAQQLNHEVMDLRSASAWILDREAQYKESLNPQQRTTHPLYYSSSYTPAAIPTGGESKQIIELLQSMLARTEMLESYIKSPQQYSILQDPTKSRFQQQQQQQEEEEEYEEDDEREEEKGRRRNHHREQKRHAVSPQPRRPRNHHVDALALGSDATQGDIRRWLQEQQLAL
ncbi:uncharacterized protein TM35_000201470 [Trypanosoma theileri]|uniref:WW domain-containing protein n=1 Tax=Trypanosoma theileri TaxID=67003 RepID=A0A1X0NT67_9TRYP|nr:uncharacterized protein TM35_000201470 [Trypanosoma theileri]ORC87738.1 hypothetical protein TM35_000201470 [Trypanosoma theileri]